MAAQGPPEIHTHHCLCSHLVLATTYNLPHVSRRVAGLDRAHILPCPPLSTQTIAAIAAEGMREHAGAYEEQAGSTTQEDVTVLTSLNLDGQPTLVRRDDGIERRFLLTCARCKLVVGYKLDWMQWPAEETKGRSGRREDVVYILPGALMGTKEMMEGKKAREEDVGFELLASV